MKQLLTFIGLSLFSVVFAEEWSFELPPTQYLPQEVKADWRGQEKLGLTVQLVGKPPETPLLLSLYIQTEEGHWLESREDLVLNGTVQRFDLSLQEDSVDWRMSNGDRVFGQDMLRRVKCWGLRLYSAKPATGVLRLGHLETRRPPTPSAVTFLPRDLPGKVSVGERVPLMVEPRNWPGDLFDPGQSPHFEIRNGEGDQILPSIWLQDYRRRQVPGRQSLQSVLWRRPVFRAFWLPEAEGEAEIYLRSSDQQTEPQFLGKIQIQAPSGVENPQKRRPHAENLDFWQSPPADKTVWQNTQAGAQWKPASLQGFWMPRLDWTSAWGRYDGLGEFMQPRAEAFETWIAQAEVSGPLRVVTEHVLDNRSTLNWQDHPWNLANGGKHLEPSPLWTDPAWMDLVLRRAVYLWNRYGAYEQCTGLYIEVSRSSEAQVAWINELTQRLHQALPGVPVTCPSPGLPERQLTGSLVIGREGWQKPDHLSGANEYIPSNPPGSMILKGASDAGFDASVSMMQHWSDQQVLQLDVEAQFSDGVFPSMQVHVRTRPDRVFSSKLIPLHNRESNRVFLDLQDPDAWHCFQDPERAWTPLERMNIREVMLRVYSDRPDPEASFKIDQVQTVTRPLAQIQAPAPLQISHLRTPAEKVKTLERQEWIFDLNRFFQNPYNPEEIAVDLQVELPDGSQRSQPGFFYQQADRAYQNGVESWTLGENYDWRIRFRPWMDGVHKWKLLVKVTPVTGGKTTLLTQQGQFTAEGLNHAKGFLLQSEKDPHYFEFQNGDFFYPLGHTMRSPTDRRPGIYDPPLMKTLDAVDAKGTEIYADWFRRMHENGGNFARVWISNWWLGLEWNSRHSGFHGRKYFNQLNAARLDRLIDLAEQYGMYLNLETTNHGTFSSGIDAEWIENPWSRFSPDEGPIRYASEFLNSEEALKWHEYKMRYLIARTGHSPSVAFWGVLTETEWTEAYFRSFRNINPRERKEYQPDPFRDSRFREPLKQWTNRTAGYLKSANAHPALATTHFSNPGNGLDFWRLPELSVVYNNAYSGFFNHERPELPTVDSRTVQHRYPKYDSKRDPFYRGIVREIFGYAEFFRKYASDDKLLLVGEWGGRPSKNQDEHLIAEFHSGLWASIVTELSGVGGFWWYNLVDYYDLFPEYTAAAKFMQGEDLRGKKFQQSRWPVTFPDQQGGSEDLRLAIGKSNRREAMGYIYSVALSHSNHSRPPDGFEDKHFPQSGTGWLRVPDSLQNGQYHVEYWNTFTGEILEKKTLYLHSENREVSVPSHRVDLAVKLKYENPLPPPTPIPVPTPIPTPTPLPPPPPTPTPLPQILNPEPLPTIP